MSTATLSPDAEEARDNATFEALMWSLSRPGEFRTLPASGLAPVAQALVDLESPVWTDDPDLTPTLERSGAGATQANCADFLFVRGDPCAAARAARPGSALYPDAAATVVVAARHEGVVRLHLTGPGIETAREIGTGLPAEFWHERNRRMAYPAGFDLFVIDGSDVIGIPRSTRIEVL